MLQPHVEALLARVAEGEALWPELGVFRLQTRPRLPGFPGYSTVQFRAGEALYRQLNDNAEPPTVVDAPSDWVPDPELAGQTARAVAEELLARGEVTVPGLGWFGVQRRKTGTENEAYFVAFRADAVVLRALNPKDKAYEAAVATEWPEGLPESAPPAEA